MINETLQDAINDQIKHEFESAYNQMVWEFYSREDGGGTLLSSPGVDRFGASAPGPIVMREFGFTPAHVVEAAKAVLKQTASS